MRSDSAARWIAATPEAIYAAFVDPQAMAAWRPPAGMRAEVIAFEPRVGGHFRMRFIYEDGGAAHPGKSSDDADEFSGHFAALEPGRRIVEQVEFTSDDPAFGGVMTVTTILTPIDGGTEVRVICDNVPGGISEADHQAGIAASLAQLAAFVG